MLRVVGALKGRLDLVALCRRLNARPQRACGGSGHTVMARGQIDRRKRSLKGFCDLFGSARWLRDELVGRKDVGIGNVAHVGPVEKVGVIADLEMGPAFLEDFGKARYCLPVPWTCDWRVSGSAVDLSVGLNSPENARRAKSDGKQAINSVGCKDQLFRFCFRFVVRIHGLVGQRNAFVDVNQVLAIEDHTRRASVDEFWNLVFLGRGNDCLRTVYIDFPVEGRILDTGGGRSCVDDTGRATLEERKKMRKVGNGEGDQVPFEWRRRPGLGH